MSRPVHANAEATRRRILEQSVRLFSEQGIGETSIRDIARASGVSLAMVHHYFFSKERLLGTCLSEVHHELVGLQADFEAIVARAPSFQDLLDQAVIATFRYARARRELVRLLLRVTLAPGNMGEGEPMVREFIDKISAGFCVTASRYPEDLRLPLQTMLYAVARYAVQDESELAWVVGASQTTESGGVLPAVEKHLSRLAAQLIATHGQEDDLESSGVRSMGHLDKAARR